jgi:hypothetical protein
MDDMDKNEIDLDEDDNNNVEDIARFVNIFVFCIFKTCISSTVQRVHRNDESINNTNDDDDDEMVNRPFTLNDGDELSDDEQLDDNEHETISNQHIHDNFKVDNERGMKIDFLITIIIGLYLEMKQIKWELDREHTYAQRSRRYDKYMKKTSKRKPKLTRREKRRQMNPIDIKKKKKRVHFS